MATLSITWHAQMDEHTCPTCKALNGHTWVFETGKDMFDGKLRVLGWVAWDVEQGSKAHGHSTYSCRCFITHEFNLEDIRAKCVYLSELVKAATEKE